MENKDVKIRFALELKACSIITTCVGVNNCIYTKI